MAEVGTFYQSKYTGEQLDEILKNVYDAVPLDGSKPMTGALDIKKVENGYSRFNKNHTQTTDLGTELKDISKGGSVVALLLKAADQAARLQFGTSVYDLIHTGNITGYVKPYADAAQAASEAAESALEGVREAIEAIPEGAATPIVNDLTTGGASMALSAEMGKRLKGELDTKVNPNLLDNWYFGNPVNQRGQTEYTAVGYTIDRWRIIIANTVVAAASAGVNLKAVGTGIGVLRQSIEHPPRLFGKTVTISALLDDGTFAFATGVVSSTATVSTQTCAIALFDKTSSDRYFAIYRENNTMFIQFKVPSGKELTVVAAKLELGTQQTLAHQDANGNWVLNEIPDYNEQLLRCCMSTADSSDTYANNKRTAAAVKAVPLNGSKAMTGNLRLQGSEPYTEAGWSAAAINMVDANNQRHAWLGALSDGAGNVQFRVANDLGGILLYPSSGVVQIASNGVQTVLHTGNKPSGSYTGNGSVTSRTIDIGGLGNVVAIWSGEYGYAIVFGVGAIAANANGAKYFSGVAIKYVNGKITVASADNFLNANGITYYYQVL